MINLLHASTLSLLVFFFFFFILRGRLLKLGTVEQRKAWDRRSNRRESRKGYFGSLRNQRKGGLGDRVGLLALEHAAAAHCSPGCKF